MTEVDHEYRPPSAEVLLNEELLLGLALRDPAAVVESIERAEAIIAYREHLNATKGEYRVNYTPETATDQLVADAKRTALLDGLDEETKLHWLIEVGQHFAGRDDEEELGAYFMAVGKWAKDQFVQANVRLVVSIASKMKSGLRNLTVDEAVQVGVMGLMEKAIDKFQPRKGFKFSTYATWWVRQQIGREDDNSGLIRTTVGLSEFARQLPKFIGYFREQEGRDPTDEDIAEFFEIKLERLKTLQEELVLSGQTSLNLPVGEDGENELGDLIPDKRVDVAEGALKGHDVVFLEELIALADLRTQEEHIIRLRWGLEDGKNWTLGEIVEEYDVTRQRIQQIEARAMRKLRGAAALTVSSPEEARRIREQSGTGHTRRRAS